MSGARHERDVFRLALLAAATPSILALLLVWLGDHEDKLRWTVTLVVVIAWLAGAAAVRERVVRPLQTLANLIAALREGDYTVRGRAATSRRLGKGPVEPGSGTPALAGAVDSAGDDDDALAAALREINLFSAALQAGRIGEREASALLSKVLAEVDVVILAFDHLGRLRLINRAGERLLAASAPALLGRTPADLGLPTLASIEGGRTVELTLPGGRGTFELKRSTFRADGLPHELYVLADVQRALREEERQAWQRIIRVLGHEINNSLAPIQSIAATLRSGTLAAEDRDAALAIIERRAAALGRFLGSYARLARLPPPRLRPVEVEPLIRRVAALETRRPVEILPVRDPAPLEVRADPDQIEQVLINLISNAVEATLETGGGVRISWRATRDDVHITVEDDGPGIANPGNLFVPFFTTKPQGSGIGLVLSRQIAENHRGRLLLENRTERSGCRAVLTLPR